jgi:hypothetical protein
MNSVYFLALKMIVRMDSQSYCLREKNILRNCGFRQLFSHHVRIAMMNSPESSKEVCPVTCENKPKGVCSVLIT